MLYVANPDRSTWKRKTRGAVLSLWRSIKRDLWEELGRKCDPETLPAPPPRMPRIVAPFRRPIEAMVAADPHVSGREILQRIRTRGYKGRYSSLMLFVGTLRPRPRPKTAAVRGLLEAMVTADPHVSVRAIFRRARENGYMGSYATLKELVTPLRKHRRTVVAPAPKLKRPPALKPTPALLSPRAAARVLGVSQDRVLLDLARGRFPGALRGRGGWRSWLIPLSDIAGPDPAPASQAG